jgi:predicted MFS family arabinose efflux permease
MKQSADGFTPYQNFVVASLAFLQFAVILDFMIVAGSADRYDRKKLLLFFYAGFVLGTLWCGLASSFHALLAARIITGVFGGVIGSIVLAIATDLFAPEQRGRVMGVIQTAFAASQILGLPAGIYLSNRWDWHAPFRAMVAIGIAAGLVVAWKLRPVTAHLAKRQEHSPWMHLFNTVREPRHWSAFVTMMLLATGGFMLMPFGSAYVVNNLGIPITSLPEIYLVTGIFTIFIGPLLDLGGRDDQARGLQRFGCRDPAGLRRHRVGNRGAHRDLAARRQARALPPISRRARGNSPTCRHSSASRDTPCLPR